MNYTEVTLFNKALSSIYTIFYDDYSVYVFSGYILKKAYVFTEKEKTFSKYMKARDSLIDSGFEVLSLERNKSLYPLL